MATERVNSYNPRTRIAEIFYRGVRHSISVPMSASYPGRPNKPEQLAMCLALQHYMKLKK